jgi:ADP-ribose pyrophosphatase YjhB (NUDIX family)
VVGVVGFADSRWVKHGEQPVWSGSSLAVAVAEVESPTGRRQRQEVVHARFDGVGVVVADAQRRVLLTWRHRFVCDEWSWELPSGVVLPGEEPTEAAARVVLDLAGWELVAPRRVWSMRRCPDRTDYLGHLVVGTPGQALAPHHPDEVAATRWFDREELWHLLRTSGVRDLSTMSALFWWIWRSGGWAGRSGARGRGAGGEGGSHG